MVHMTIRKDNPIKTNKLNSSDTNQNPIVKNIRHPKNTATITGHDNKYGYIIMM